MQRVVASLALTTALALAACGEAQPSPSVPPTTTSAESPTASAPATAAPEPAESPVAGPNLPGLWTDATASTIGQTAEWTNRGELADVNGDALVDILFANGGNYDSPGDPEPTRVFLNQGPGQPFVDATTQILGDFAGIVRVVKVRDLNADGNPELLLGTTFQTQSRLFIGSGGGTYTDATADALPQLPLSVGDAEIGDVDGDGDLDIALADWGPGNPMENEGARVRLWLNDGAARFTDVTDTQMPATLVRFSWDLEFVNVDYTYDTLHQDLDLAVSSKRSETSFLYENDGFGVFTDVTADRLPHFTNNYDFEPIDLNADGSLDLLTINDGDNLTGSGPGEHAFLNDGSGVFADATADLWPRDANIGEDDNVIVVLDVESDHDADFVIGSLTGADRLLVNHGLGRLLLEERAFIAEHSGGTLWMGAADLNGDARLDFVEAQGEVPGHLDERVYLATDVLPPDAAAPVVDLVLTTDGPLLNGGILTIRIHDNRSSNMPHDWRSVVFRWTANGEPFEQPLVWYGEHMWRSTVPSPEAASNFEVCATDAAGNQTCRQSP